MTPEQEAKLPRFARDELSRLRSQVRALDEACVQSNVVPEMSRRGVYKRTLGERADHRMGYLYTWLGGDYTGIVFHVDDNDDIDVTLRGHEDGTGIMVQAGSGASRLAIVPEASNAVRVETEYSRKRLFDAATERLVAVQQAPKLFR